MTIPDDAIVTVISSDKQKCELPAKAAKISGLIKNTLFSNEDDEEMDDADKMSTDPLEIELLRVDGATLNKIKEFLLHYNDSPFESIKQDTFIENTFEKCIKDEYYSKFMQELDGEEAEKQQSLFEVKAAANYMEITPLLEVICLWVMFKIEKAKTKQEVLDILKLPAMTTEDEKKYRDEAPWMFKGE